MYNFGKPFGSMRMDYPLPLKKVLKGVVKLMSIKLEMEKPDSNLESLTKEFNTIRASCCNHDLVFLVNTSYDGYEGRSYEEVICLGCLSYGDRRKGTFKYVITKENVKDIIVPGSNKKDSLPIVLSSFLSDQYLSLLFRYTSYYLKKEDTGEPYRPHLVAKFLYNQWVNESKTITEDNKKPLVLGAKNKNNKSKL